MKYSEFLAEHERQRIDSMHPDGPSIDWEEVFEHYRSNIARIKREIQEVD